MVLDNKVKKMKGLKKIIKTLWIMKIEILLYLNQASQLLNLINRLD